MLKSGSVQIDMYHRLVPDAPPEAAHVLRTYALMGGKFSWHEALIAAELADMQPFEAGIFIDGMVTVRDTVAEHRAKALEH